MGWGGNEQENKAIRGRPDKGQRRAPVLREDTETKAARSLGPIPCLISALSILHRESIDGGRFSDTLLPPSWRGATVFFPVPKGCFWKQHLSYIRFFGMVRLGWRRRVPWNSEILRKPSNFAFFCNHIPKRTPSLELSFFRERKWKKRVAKRSYVKDGLQFQTTREKAFSVE